MIACSRSATRRSVQANATLFGAASYSGSGPLEPFPELGDFPMVVAAERQQAIQLSKRAGSYRALKRSQLIECCLHLVSVKDGIAAGLLQQRLFRLDNQIGHHFPIAAYFAGDLSS